MILLWILLRSLAGLLMSLAHPFELNDIAFEPGLLHFVSASVGLAVFMKVSSLRAKAKTRFFLGFWADLFTMESVCFGSRLPLKPMGSLVSGLPCWRLFYFLLTAPSILVSGLGFVDI